ncbi:helix-hairpin-helix domain-containing protein [uncultured Alistipes sp.]|uniref:helix-hairpin-helix domain-containing protein n=1 Tax=uncultured Alistipes sp. TaxID=538949 RepID=UPI002639DF2B|nr:helix-hairpin-helix domain-containing protein [uncultured Alistipes sp.]
MWSREDRRTLLLLLPLLLLAVAAFVLLEPRASKSSQAARHAPSGAAAPAAELFEFDPNTVDYRQLRRLGFSKQDAAGVLRYRAAGKIFRIPEDFAACYQVSDSMYDRLEPYIRIGAEYRYKPRYDTLRRSSRRTFERRKRDTVPLVPFRIDTMTARFLRAIGFTKRQAEAIADYNTLIGGFRDEEELRGYAIIGDSAGRRLAAFAIFPERRRPLHDPVELNTADSATLRTVSGIGEKTVVTILDYRRRLGGFHRAEQLAEVPGVMERNYERIIKQISVDSCRISKIDINFAPPNMLAEHPYIPPRMLRKILKRRQLKGGWSTLQEMIDENILSPEEAERLRPYLRFRVHDTANDD